VLEPLSDPLRKLLLEHRLCTAADLRRCRRLVRNLTDDLPAFDSVWLDALVQIGRLTPYQARILESTRPEAIRIGPCVAAQRIGSGPFGTTLLARPVESNDQCVIKYLTATDRLSTETVERLENYVTAARGLHHPSLVCPISCIPLGAEVALVSRYVAGSHLGELLVRRGRFPASVVWEIGRQLADGLQALAHLGLTHGDIRSSNVRLTATGTAVLVDAGIRLTLDPVLTMHSGLAPERYDGIAPELIGVGGQRGVATDAYALGCLLWQLLAGRPPFPGGDPLVKLAAHQTRTIEDVRHWAPDTPAPLAEGIARMTSRNPADRPPRFADLLEFWGPPNRGGRRRIAAFRRRFDLPARSVAERRAMSAPTRWLFIATSLFALSGGVATLVNQGARTAVLRWANGISMRLQESDQSPAPADNSDRPTSAPAGASRSNSALPALPAPDRHGVVHLESAGPYRATDLTLVGALSIVGDDTTVAHIVIGDQPFKLCAESVRLKNVRFVTGNTTPGRSENLRALIHVTSQILAIEGCHFDSGGTVAASPVRAAPAVFAPSTGPALMAWRLLDTSDQRGGTATIRNSVLLGDGPALYLAHAVRKVTCDNVLKVGPGPLVQLAAVPEAKQTVALQLTHATIRAAGAVVRWVIPTEGLELEESNERIHGGIQVEANDCVFDIDSPRAALFELAGAQPRPEWLRSLRMTGEGSITRPTLEVAAWVSTVDGRLTPLDGMPLEVEGLIAGEFRFAGEFPEQPAASEVRDSDAPRRSPSPPGVHAATLPGS
jgi:serine/threonine protein kinase